MKILKSVGCALSSDGMTYALNDDGKIEYFTDVHLDDCCVEWYDRLSDKDNKIVNKIKKEL